jgi:phytoene dehydrogenase-like protein
VLAELGIDPAGAAPRGSGSLALDGGQVHALPVGLVSMLSSGLLGLGEKLEAARTLQGLGSVDPASLAGQTVRQWIDRTARRAGARRLLEALVRVATYANAPDLAAADETVRQLQRAAGEGVLYVDGGWQSIVEALRARAVEAGAEIRLSARAVSVDGGRVRLADGSAIDAGPGGAVVVAASPSVAADLVPGSASLAAAARAAIPIRAACLDLVLSALPRPRARFCLGIDEPLYYSLHSATAKLGPDGLHVIHAARYLAPGETADASSIEAMLDRLQPGWRGHVVARRFLPQLVVAGDLHAAGRARPEPVVADAPGVLVIGDWVGRGAMLADASLASAREAATRLLERASVAPAAPEPKRAWG